nr:MAG TPA: hypothetical protein [Caudoviricetes sp.]
MLHLIASAKQPGTSVAHSAEMPDASNTLRHAFTALRTLGFSYHN